MFKQILQPLGHKNPDFTIEKADIFYRFNNYKTIQHYFSAVNSVKK